MANKDFKNGAVFIELSLYQSLPVVVQLLHGIITVAEGGDQVRLDSLT